MTSPSPEPEVGRGSPPPCERRERALWPTPTAVRQQLTGLSKCRWRKQPQCQQSFSSFCHFFILKSFDDAIYLHDRQGLVPIWIVKQQFCFRRLFAALRSVTMKRHSIIAWTGGSSSTYGGLCWETADRSCLPTKAAIQWTAVSKILVFTTRH
jgi:hypothetical protein